MGGLQGIGPQIQENGTFLSNKELLDGQQPEALMALVINSTLDKQQEAASHFRTNVMNSLGKGLRVNTEV